jgi:putative phosphoesterase
MLALIIGDLHIPLKAHSIPTIVRENLGGGKINKILCTGNLTTRDELNFLKSFCPDIQMVRGEFDDDDLPDVDQIVDSVSGFNIGVVSGYTLIPGNDKAKLQAKARELDVDILAFGGGHRAGVFQDDGILFINPGSATGAYSSMTPNAQPSFVLIKFQGSNAFVYTYILGEDGTFMIEKERFSKDDPDE